MPETVLVTGGTGFVAGWCIVELLQRGYRVRTTVRSSAKQTAVRLAVAQAHEFDDKLSFAIADLTRDEGWDAAMVGIDYVLHVASPLGNNTPRQAETLIAPAREGTLRVLRAATRAGVKRVVMTSAAAAARPPHRTDDVSDEAVWTDPADRTFDAYRLSKILAERAAWDFMASHGGTTEFTTILPGAVFGPVLSKDNLGSVQIIDRLLQGRPPGLPRLGFWIVDVRDLADLHIRAMTAPPAAGQRFLAAGDFMWMQDVAQTLRSKLGAKAAQVPTRRMPDVVFKMMALVIPQLRMFTPELGRKLNLSTAKARQLLGFAPRSAQATIVACAESLLVN
ncbi:aldehyde reductase [Bradyrhizobium prioriisuperbiae]|uniref:SDR family oxidoreductase n=1 Tax=Bradyrhizobium prioriisuperbiae TaxID=2854389 RepID=UPI0028E31D5E|nr:aldehyde reductase [Bradyrhizobium prioritasuperba]